MRRQFALIGFALLVSGCASEPGGVPGSPAPTPLPSAIASTQATSLPTPTATPAFSDALLPGATATVVVDSLRLRSDPGTGDILATMPQGSVVYFAGPPFERSADGITWRFMWYASGWADWPVFPPDPQSGWAATEDSDNAFFVPGSINCPAGTADTNAIFALPEAARVECFGDNDLGVEGTVISGYGGLAPGVYEPAWLAAPFGFSGAIQTVGGPFFYHRESGERSPYSDGERLRITGHYADPAANTCTIATGEPPIPEPDEFAVAYCREIFVATHIEVVN
jgi:hypothetical protein